jgi:hypothetical protein
MKLIPYEKLVLKSALEIDELKQRLIYRTEPKKFWSFRGFAGNSKTYEGTIVGNSFELRRIINYRNDFRPYIVGEMKREGETTLIPIVFTPGTFVLVILGISGAGLSLANLYFLIKLAAVGTFEPPGIASLVVFGIFYLVILVSFRYEVSTSKKDLMKYFNASL